VEPPQDGHKVTDVISVDRTQANMNSPLNDERRLFLMGTSTHLINSESGVYAQFPPQNLTHVVKHYVAFAMLASLFVGMSFIEANAQRSNTRVIVAQDVSTSAKRVVLDARKARGAFRNIRLINRGQRIRFSSLRIIYSDGTSDRIGRTFRLSSGERTRILNKSNTLKFVDKVIADIRPERRRRARRTRLELQGTQTRREARLTRNGGKKAGFSDDFGDHNVLFGYRDVRFDEDREDIKIGREIGRFSHLRLNVFGNDVFVRDVRIDYVDGTSQFVPFSTTIKKGKSSEWFEVRKSRFIDKIVLLYRAQKGRKKSARIEVTGQYAKNWLDPAGDGRKYNNGWVLLGAETAGAIGYDTDTITVGRNKGGFKELRVKVRDRSITLRELRVVYRNGRSKLFKLTQRVDPGQTVGPLALPNGRTAIAKIEAKYRSRLFFGKGQGTAMVEVWGRH